MANPDFVTGSRRTTQDLLAKVNQTMTMAPKTSTKPNEQKMAIPLFFPSVDELLKAVFEALQEPDSLKTVITRAQASKAVREQLTPEDLALLLLMCDPVLFPLDDRQPIDLPVAEENSLPNVIEFDPANPGDLSDSEKRVALLTNMFREESERQELAIRTYPQLAMIASSSWASVVLPYLEHIQKIYGSDNPFKRVNDYVARYFFESSSVANPWTQQDVPKDSQKMVRSLAAFLLKDWRGSELGAMRTIARVYLGEAPLGNLASIDPPALMQELLGPERNLWKELDFGHF